MSARLRLWLAELFYGWACRLQPDRYQRVTDLKLALDLERSAAAEWEIRYDKLWEQIKAARTARTVVF